MSRLPNNLDDWLAYIEAGHPTEIDLGLGRLRPVAESLELLSPWPVPVVTVAGTNGKGSTVAFIAAIAAAHGLRVGTYTSPHFLRYNERVRLDGVEASDAQLCEAFQAVEQARSTLGVSLTYFEYGTLAALWLFRRAAQDLLVLEVGLGGRLDAVNLVDPSVAVVTTVALDHQDWLGDDRETIGREKAGISRPGRPLVYGEADMPVSIRDLCTEQGTPLLHWGVEFGPTVETDGHWGWSGIDALGEGIGLDALPSVSLPFANASTALQALASAGFRLEREAVCNGLASAQLTGRMQRLSVAGREVCLDVAHNPHAAAHLAACYPAADCRTWCVAGMLADKDIPATLAVLTPRVDRWCLATLTGPRGAKAETLQAALAGAAADTFDNVSQALDAVIEQSAAGDRILVMGSFYTVAAALAYFQEAE